MSQGPTKLIKIIYWYNFKHNNGWKNCDGLSKLNFKHVLYSENR